MLPIRSLFLVFVLGISMLTAHGQTYVLKGIVMDGKYHYSLPNASVQAISLTDSVKKGVYADSLGHFSIRLGPGKYSVSVTYLGYEPFYSNIYVIKDAISLDTIFLNPGSTSLKEVKIIEKAVTQKDDTIEYVAGAYKTNPDADAVGLVRKMPGMDVNGKEVKAQGETVTRVLIDGKPFFGNDPYASLRNLPAEIIDRVQVYNERTEQEQFTGFSEGNTTKTINIITKPDKRNGEFGKLYTGYGTGDRYLGGGSINQFDGDRRTTITAQTNNVNAQNFSDQDLVGLPGEGGGGIATTNSAGVNYSDKWGKNIDISGSYFFNTSRSILQTQTHRTYVVSADSGQVYDENSFSANQNYNHRFSMQFNYKIDSSNSLLFQPNLSLQKNYGDAHLQGNTKQSMEPLNQTINDNSSGTFGNNFSGNLLFRHKFHKKGRTFSLNINANNNHNNGSNYLTAQNVFYNNTTLSDTLNQRVLQLQNTWNVTANATYTEPVSAHGIIEIQYNVHYIPGRSDRNAFSFKGSPVQDSLYLPDSLLSNTFSSQDISHKIGTSYMLQHNKFQFSAGLYYQVTNLHNHQFLPAEYNLNRSFGNLLPMASLQFKFTSTKYFQLMYNTFTYVPSVSQLQNVINNTNPLQLTTGNPTLREPYQHNLNLHYSSTNLTYSSTFFISLSGTYTQDYITNNSIIAINDTPLNNNIVLPKGSQLTMPVNVDGYWGVNAYMSYGLPVALIKSNLNLNMNGGITRIPGIINHEINYANKKNGGIGITLSSNINENIDFTLSSNTSINADKNTLNTNLNNIYVNQSNKAFLNLILWRGFEFNTELSYQYNSGLSSGFNQNYLLWNMSIGKKLFKKHQGDIRLVVYDLLKQNNNIQHSVTATYIEDMRTNTLQRYFMLTFSYSIKNFRK